MQLTKITKEYFVERTEEWTARQIIEISEFEIGDVAGDSICCRIDVTPYIGEEGTTVDVSAIYQVPHPVDDATHP